MSAMFCKLLSTVDERLRALPTASFTDDFMATNMSVRQIERFKLVYATMFTSQRLQIRRRQLPSLLRRHEPHSHALRPPPQLAILV
jgi:hypothetical protein